MLQGGKREQNYLAWIKSWIISVLIKEPGVLSVSTYQKPV